MQRSKEKRPGTEKTRTSQKPQKPKFSYKEQREYETIDEEIANLEESLAEIETEMLKNATDFPKLAKLTEEKAHLDAQLTEMMERWEYLSELAEKIANYKN